MPTWCAASAMVCFFFTLITGPSRFYSVKLSDARVRLEPACRSGPRGEKRFLCARYPSCTRPRGLETCMPTWCKRDGPGASCRERHHRVQRLNSSLSSGGVHGINPAWFSQNTSAGSRLEGTGFVRVGLLWRSTCQRAVHLGQSTCHAISGPLSGWNLHADLVRGERDGPSASCRERHHRVTHHLFPSPAVR